MIPIDLAGEPSVILTTEVDPASVGLNRFDFASKLGSAVELGREWRGYTSLPLELGIGSHIMRKQVFMFWPGDGRKAPNDLARPSIEKATRQLEQALRKLGREPRLIEGFIAKPHESIEKLGPIDDPMIGVCVHWIYAPHTTEGVVGKRNPLLLASNFAGEWPGLAC
jgi:hypothetical protein